MLLTKNGRGTQKLTRNNSSKPTEAALECACDCAAQAPRARVCQHLPLIPAVVLVLLPKCPLCLAAWFGIFGSLGATSWLNAVWGTPLAAGFLSLTVGTLAMRARGSRDARPLCVGIIGAVALLCGKCLVDVPLLICVGLGLLLSACFWSGRLKSTRTKRFLEHNHKARHCGSSRCSTDAQNASMSM